jgi:hypothetical protein
VVRNFTCDKATPAKRKQRSLGRSDYFGSFFSNSALNVDSACSFRSVYGPSVRDPWTGRGALLARSLEIELRS